MQRCRRATVACALIVDVQLHVCLTGNEPRLLHAVFEMATTALDRLLFAQGGDCFFCHQSLPRSEASVEHLVASTLGGGDTDENCVACCKTLNRLFGRMSLKEKMQLLLKQRGNFQCPAGFKGTTILKANEPILGNQASKKTPENISTLESQVYLAAEDLRKRGNSRPGNEEKLLNTIRSALMHKGQAEESTTAVFDSFKARGWIQISEGKVTYHLPPKM